MYELDLFFSQKYDTDQNSHQLPILESCLIQLLKEDIYYQADNFAMRLLYLSSSSC